MPSKAKQQMVPQDATATTDVIDVTPIDTKPHRTLTKAEKHAQAPKIKHAAKRKAALRSRAKIVVRELAQGASLQDAGITAGYSPSYAAEGAKVLLKNPRVQDSFNSILEAAGVTDEKIASKLHGLLDAKKVVITKDYGKVEVPDNTTQLNATQLAAKLKGHLVDRSVNVNLNADLHPVDLTRYCNTEDVESVQGIEQDGQVVDITSNKQGEK